MFSLQHWILDSYSIELRSLLPLWFPKKDIIDNQNVKRVEFV